MLQKADWLDALHAPRGRFYSPEVSSGDTTIVKSSSSTEADAGIFDPTTAQDVTKIVLSRSNSHAKAVPRRFKTAYIFFTIARNKEIREMAGLEGQKCLEVRVHSFSWARKCSLSVSLGHGNLQGDCQGMEESLGSGKSTME